MNEVAMKEKLVSAINEIRNNKSMLISDEASIKSGVILRLLSILGWNPFDVNEVKPEYAVESKRVDLSLRINGINKSLSRLNGQMKIWRHIKSNSLITRSEKV